MPLPESNSDAAKQMRCVVILGQLARSTAIHVLQPTHLFPANGCIGSVLTRQARDDSRKESAIRALFQAMLPNEHDAYATRAVDRACKEVMALTERLLGPDRSTEFTNQLKALVQEACVIWREIRRSEFAIEPSFEENSSDWDWDELWFDAGKPVIGQQKRRGDVERERVALVVFPRLLAIDEESEYPESQGVLFMKSQTRIAQEETERPPPGSSPLRRSPTVSRKSPRTRKTSTEGQSIPTTAESHSFLGGRA